MKLYKINFLLIIFLILLTCKSTNITSNNQNKKNYNYTGIIKKINKFSGTLSEYSYYILKSEIASLSSKEIILFNKETKDSRGFDEYVNKKVKITGREIIGFIGWKKQAKPGILVEKIKIIKIE